MAYRSPDRARGDRLEDAGRLWEKSSGLYEALGLAIWHEETVERAEFYRRNGLRREILQLAARASDANEELAFDEGQAQFIAGTWLEVITAARLLAHYDLIKLDEMLGHSFYLEITHRGYDLAGNESELRKALPTSATEDEAAHATVARPTRWTRSSRAASRCWPREAGRRH